MVTTTMGDDDLLSRANAAAAGAAWLLRQRLLDRMDVALAREGVTVLLVKGAAMAHRYAQPWRRSMADIDLLLRPGDAAAVARALVALGLSRCAPPPQRRHSRQFFFETSFVATQGGAQLLVEAHTQLDKMVARPIDLDAIMARATPRQPRSSLWLPGDEDHVLLLVLHAAVSDYSHPAAWRDLALLWRPPLDVAMVLQRAHRWRMMTALHVALQHMRRQGIEVSDEVLLATRPGVGRQWWVRRVYLRRRYAAQRRLGWAWVRRQSALRDDVFAWYGGVMRYAWCRLRDGW